MENFAWHQGEKAVWIAFRKRKLQNLLSSAYITSEEVTEHWEDLHIKAGSYYSVLINIIASHIYTILQNGFDYDNIRSLTNRISAFWGFEIQSTCIHLVP